MRTILSTLPSTQTPQSQLLGCLLTPRTTSTCTWAPGSLPSTNMPLMARTRCARMRELVCIFSQYESIVHILLRQVSQMARNQCEPCPDCSVSVLQGISQYRCSNSCCPRIDSRMNYWSPISTSMAVIDGSTILQSRGGGPENTKGCLWRIMAQIRLMASLRSHWCQYRLYKSTGQMGQSSRLTGWVVKMDFTLCLKSANMIIIQVYCRAEGDREHRVAQVNESIPDSRQNEDKIFFIICR